MTLSSFAAAGVLDEVLLRGKTLDIADAVLDAQFSVGIDTIGELALTVYDPSFEILASGLFDPGGAVALRGWRQEITRTETDAAADGRGQVTVRCRSRAIGALDRRRGSKVMQKASPSDFVISECKAVRAKWVVQKSSRRKSVARDTRKSEDAASGERPSSWTTFQRLARELGYAVFEAHNTVYFGKPSWLRKQDGEAARVTWDQGTQTDCIGVPRFADELDPNETGVSVTFDVPRERLDEFAPGARVVFDFPIYGEQKYLVTGLTFPVVGTGWAQVTAGKPVDPKPEPPAKKARPATTRAGAGFAGGGGPRPQTRVATLGDLLRRAGFSGDALNVAAGVAIAESGGSAGGGRYFVDAHALGDTTITDAKWGPSVGVFQIRSLRNPGAWSGLDAMRDQAKLRGALYNAQLAFKMSGGGRNWSAWSAYTNGRYRAYVGQLDAQVRNWTTAPVPAARPPARPPAAPGGPPNPTSVTGRKSAFDFVNLCLRQAGDRYVFGAEASPSDPDPDAFDCSELIEWAARRVGCFIPDGSSSQIAYCRPISVTAGRATRGALLWIPGHIAVSLGGGTGTIEAANPSYGVVRFGPSRSFGWQRAGLIPGMRYG